MKTLLPCTGVLDHGEGGGENSLKSVYYVHPLVANLSLMKGHSTKLWQVGLLSKASELAWFV